MIKLGNGAMKNNNYKLALLYYRKAKSLDSKNMLTGKLILRAQKKLQGQ